MAHTLHVVSHTHWDREWHLTFQQFRLRLVDLVDRLLEILDSDPEFRLFSLDAQTIVLEDYLQIRPHAGERLEKHIRSGRIAVGPWYQLNDQFLTSAESTVRSLLVGHRIAHQFGADAHSYRIGYLPDQFGNISQMPQILRGFGIDNVIVGRGYQLVDGRKMEFWWEGPDGSRVLASLMAFWYNNAQRLPSDVNEAVEFVLRLRDVMAPRSASKHLLLMNGVDHLEAQPDAGRIINAVNTELARRGIADRLVHSTLAAYVDALREEFAPTPNPAMADPATIDPAMNRRAVETESDAEARLRRTTADSGDSPRRRVWSSKPGDSSLGAPESPLQIKTGELREDRGGACLAGTLSTRMYLKQANHSAQIALERYAERLCSFARILGARYPYDQLHYAWKLLMQNHPHDSICGCSIDQVHREMMPRFQQVEQIADELVARALDALTGRDRTKGAVDDANRIVVFNTLNWARTDPVITTLEFPLGPPTRGNPPRDDSKAVRGFRITDSAGAEVPFAVTHIDSTIRTVLNPHELPLDQWVQRITVEFIAQSIPACGCRTFHIEVAGAMPAYPVYDRIAEGVSFIREFEDLEPDFEDVGDAGDEYLFRSPLVDTLVTAGTCIHTTLAEVRQDNAVRVRRIVRRALPTPASGDAGGRSPESVDLPLRLTETMWRGVQRVEYRIDADNTARDHRLRLTWRIGASERVSAAGQFDVVERPPRSPQRSEGASSSFPFEGWLDVDWPWEDDGVSLTVVSRGMPEYEVFEESSPEGIYRTLAVTLLRCVGQLSGRGDGPGTPTPDAQCIGQHMFELAALKHAGDWRQAQVWKQAHQFNVPLVAVQCPSPSSSPSQDSERSFLTVEPAELVVSAIKRAEDRDSLILRFYNTVDVPVEGRIRLPGAGRHRLANLNEEPQEEWHIGPERELTVEQKKIVTVEFEI